MPIAVDTLQFVLFTGPVPDRSSLSLWQKAFRSDPLGFNSLPGGMSQTNGIQGTYSLVLQAQPTRIDLIVAAAAATPADDPSIDDIIDAAENARRALSRLTPTLNVERVALIVQRAQVHPDATAAVNAVKAAVPGLPAPDAAVDLSYQTGVTRESKAVPGVKLTFLRRWNTGLKTLLQVTVQAGQTVSFGGPQKIVSADYLDLIATSPQKLFPKKVDALLEELAHIAAELLSGGYGSIA